MPRRVPERGSKCKCGRYEICEGFYPCKPDIFAATYEAVEAGPPAGASGSEVPESPAHPRVAPGGMTGFAPAPSDGMEERARTLVNGWFLAANPDYRALTDAVAACFREIAREAEARGATRAITEMGDFIDDMEKRDRLSTALREPGK